MVHRPSCPTACGIILHQGANLCSLYGQVDRGGSNKESRQPHQKKGTALKVARMELC